MTIEFWFDFGSPNAFLVHRVVPQIEARLGIAFDYRPALLGGLFKLTGNRSPVEAYREIPHKLAYERLEFERFIERYAIDDYAYNPHFPVNTLQMMRGAIAARELGLMRPYVDAIFDGMWSRQLQMDDAQIMRAAIDEAELPADEIIALSQEAHIKTALIAETQELFDKGAFGIPTFFVGGQIFFGKDKLREVEEACLLRGRERDKFKAEARGTNSGHKEPRLSPSRRRVRVRNHRP